VTRERDSASAAPPGPDRSTGTQSASPQPAERVLALQRAVGNTAVTRLIGATIQRDWQGDDIKAEPNAPPTKVASDRPGGKPIRRIRVEGIAEGYATDTKKPQPDVTGVDETGSYSKISGQTAEAPGGKTSGRAVVLVPEDLPKTDTVEVLFLLHGFTAGWRTRLDKQLPAPKPPPRRRGEKPKPPPPPPPPIPIEPEDIGLDRIAQQLDASKRSMIAILPQGTSRSFFGHDTAEVNAKKYIEQVFGLLKDSDFPFGKKPAHVGGIVLSAHSGAGHALGEMLHSVDPTARDRKTKGPLEHLIPDAGKPGAVPPGSPKSVTDTAYVEGVVVFDTINPAGETTATNQYNYLVAYVTQQLNRELGELHQQWTDAQASSTSDADVAKKQEAWLASSGFRFRAFATGGSGGYGKSFNAVKGQIDGWFRAKQSVLGGKKSSVYQAFYDNYQVAAAGTTGATGHISMLGGQVEKGTRQHENLKSALNSLPKPGTTPGSGDPIPAKPPPPKPVKAPARTPRPAKTPG
jgi:hypothetical protein